MKIAIDFDGVICDLKGIVRGHDFSNCEPKENAIDAIDWLLAQGHDIWIFTARKEEEWKDIYKWLRKWNIPPLAITNTKKNATIYLDDRAVRFQSWVDFCKYLG